MYCAPRATPRPAGLSLCEARGGWVLRKTGAAEQGVSRIASLQQLLTNRTPHYPSFLSSTKALSKTETCSGPSVTCKNLFITSKHWQPTLAGRNKCTFSPLCWLLLTSLSNNDCNHVLGKLAFTVLALLHLNLFQDLKGLLEHRSKKRNTEFIV